MKSIYSFIVKPMEGQRYKNTKEIEGISLIINTSEEEFKFSNREAVVVSTPIAYSGPIKEGDILLVHHNVFKFYNDMKGRRRSGKSYFKDDLFFVDSEQFYLYKRDGEWHSHDRYCFVEPIKAVDSYIYKPLTEEPLMGKMLYPNEYLKSKGVKAGDLVCFQPDSEYEFNIDDKKVYRMFDHQITIVL